MKPQIGQEIKMFPVTMDEQQNRQVYKTRVADVNDGQFAVEIPVNEDTGRIGYFAVGSFWHVWYIGEDGYRYDFQTQIVGRKSENIPLLILGTESDVQRTQRRNYLRVEMSVDLAVKVDDNLRNYHFLARSKDVSGGGLAFTCDATYKLVDKEKIKLWMVFPTRHGQVLHAKAVGQIARIQTTERPGIQLVSVKFVEISEVDQAKIVRACFERQLDMRKKGLME